MDSRVPVPWDGLETRVETTLMTVLSSRFLSVAMDPTVQ